MVRVVRTEEGAAVDAGQVMPGRGAYVHADPECLTRAVKRGGLARTLHCAVPDSMLQTLMDRAESALHRRTALPGGDASKSDVRKRD